jgi:hypothetical protein
VIERSFCRMKPRSPVVERAHQAGGHRIRCLNQVGFWVEADFAFALAAKDL